MNTDPLTLTTSEAREHNPKAVFFGGRGGIITPLALYLAKRNVELFSGKILSDAFFGDYFFYIGDLNGVKKMLVTSGGTLPKTLLLLTMFSDIDEISKLLENHKQIKWVSIGGLLDLNESQVEEIMNFYLSDQQKKLILEEPEKTPPPDQIVEELMTPKDHKKETKLNPDSSVRDAEKNLASKKSEVIQTVKLSDSKTNVEINANFSQNDETHSNINSLFKTQTNFTIDKKSKTQKGLSLLMAAVTVFLVALIFPLVAIFLEFGIGNFYLTRQYKMLKTGNVAGAKSSYSWAKFFLQTTDKSLAVVEPIFSLTRQDGVYRMVARFMSDELLISEGINNLVKAGESSNVLLSAIFGRTKGVVFGQLISDINGDLSLADTQFSLLLADLKTDAFAPENLKLPEFSKKYLEALVAKITEVRNQIHFSQISLQILPEAIGLYGKRTFLLVFQNNMEIRPTGGFIGSYGLVTLEDGMFTLPTERSKDMWIHLRRYAFT